MEKRELIALFSFMQVHRINDSGIVLTYKFKCYRIAAMRVVDDSLIAVCVHSFSIVKWSLTEGSVTKQLHGGAGREQVTRVNLASDHVASKGILLSFLIIIIIIINGRTFDSRRGQAYFLACPVWI